MSKCKPKIVDLFCGCGGMSLGAARAGFRVVAGVDSDIRALTAHKKNFRNSRHLNLDIGNLSGEDLLASLPMKDRQIDGIVGGPPCQGFSSIGARDTNDPRNQLFAHFFRLVSEIQPSFFLCENVPGILNPQYDHVRSAAFENLGEAFEVLGPMKLKASDYGAPTTRCRVFYVGFRKELDIDIDESDFAPSKDTERITVDAALKGLPKWINPNWQSPEEGWRRVYTSTNGSFGSRLSSSIPHGVGDTEAIERLGSENRVSGCLGTIHTKQVIKRFARLGPGERDDTSKAARLDGSGFCPTIRAGTGTDRGSHQALRPIHPTEDRMITPREAARLQGFPDWFQFDNTKWHSFRQIGNSVSPILAEVVLNRLYNTAV